MVKQTWLSQKSIICEIGIICTCSDLGQSRYKIWIKCDKRQMTSCIHKMWERTYGKTNITRGSAHWAYIAHLTIEWYWSKFQREIIITLKNHLEWRVGLSDTFWKGHTQGPSMPSLAPFGQAVSEEKIFLTLANQKKELILAAMFVGRKEPNEEA